MSTSIQATNNAAVSINGAAAVLLGKSATISGLQAIDVIQEPLPGSTTTTVEVSNTPLDRIHYFLMFVDGEVTNVKWGGSAQPVSMAAFNDLFVVRGKGVYGAVGSLDTVAITVPGTSAVNVTFVIGRDATGTLPADPTVAVADLNTPGAGDLTITGTGFISVPPFYTDVVIAGVGAETITLDPAFFAANPTATITATSIFIPAAALAGPNDIGGSTVAVVSNGQTSAPPVVVT